MERSFDIEIPPEVVSELTHALREHFPDMSFDSIHCHLAESLDAGLEFKPCISEVVGEHGGRLAVELVVHTDRIIKAFRAALDAADDRS